MDDLRISVESDTLADNVDVDSARFSMGFRQRHSPSLVNLFSNRDVLAKRLKNRLDRDELISRNIIPAHSSAPVIYEKATQLERKKTVDLIQRKIRVRPSRRQLIDRHILNDSKADPSLQERLERLERLRIADQLNERLAVRPGPIELIHDHILAVEDNIATAIEHGDVKYESTCDDILSPGSFSDGSPTGLSDIESSISGLNCTSPSPPPSTDVFSEAFKACTDGNLAVKASTSTELSDIKQPASKVKQEAVLSPSIDRGNLIAALASCPPVPKAGNSILPISVSQKENEELVRSFSKKPKQSKPKVKKLKFHEYGPPDIKPETLDAPLDDRYKRLLEQQTLYLRLQVMQQNAMLNALRGNTESMDAVTEAIENAVENKLEKVTSPDSKDGMQRKFLDDLRVIELRAQCKQRGLIVSGPKAKLIERLKAYESGQSLPSDFNQNHIAQNSFDKVGLVPLNTSSSQSAVSPISPSIIHVTSYAACGRQQSFVVQSPRMAQHALHFVGDAGIPQSQLRIQQIDSHPVVSVSQPRMVTMQDPTLVRTSSASRVDMQPTSQVSPVTTTLERSQSLQFQFSPPAQSHAPPIVFHPMGQHAPVKHKMQPVHVPVYSQQTVYNQNSLVFVPNISASDFQLSQSVPPGLFYRQDMAMPSSEFQGSLGCLTSVIDDEPTRVRAASEPASSLQRRHRNAWSKKEAGAPSPLSFSPSGHRAMSSTAEEMKPEPPLSTDVSGNLASESGSCPKMSSLDIDQPNKSLDQTYEDIMDIIGELSTPSPGPVGNASPLSSLYTGQPLPTMALRNDATIVYTQPFFFDGKPKTPVSNFLAVNQKKIKSFGSVPSDMNCLGVSPVQQHMLLGGCNGFSGSEGDLSASCGNVAGSLRNHIESSGNFSGSAGNLLNTTPNSSAAVSGFGNPSLSSSTGNLAQSNRLDGFHQAFLPNYQHSPRSTYLSPVSPMNIDEQTLTMELESLTSNADLSWLNLNASANSSPLIHAGMKDDSSLRSALPAGSLQHQELFGQPRTGQFAMFASSPSRHDEYGAMFDMEAAGEF